ncbi:hypothetical protein QQ054_07735 [Oscillatoria amoena NRMC-F 0135]|nr:hypothetical protein [Oscillatoria amoena NRMC-F 0135]
MLDDFDITASVKVWMQHPDETLAYLSKSLINRRLPKIIFQNTAFSAEEIDKVKEEVKIRKNIKDSEINYYVFSGSVHNNAYSGTQVSINILQKDGNVNDVGRVSDNYSISSMSRDVEKFYLCYPK